MGRFCFVVELLRGKSAANKGTVSSLILDLTHHYAMATLNPDNSCGVQDISLSAMFHHTQHTQSILTVKHYSCGQILKIVEVLVLLLFLNILLGTVYTNFN